MKFSKLEHIPIAFLCIIIFILVFIAAERKFYEEYKDENKHVKVLKKEAIKFQIDGKIKYFYYIKCLIEGHEYFILKESELISKYDKIIHCLDCKKCKLEKFKK